VELLFYFLDNKPAHLYYTGLQQVAHDSEDSTSKTGKEWILTNNFDINDIRSRQLSEDSNDFSSTPSTSKQTSHMAEGRELGSKHPHDKRGSSLEFPFEQSSNKEGKPPYDLNIYERPLNLSLNDRREATISVVWCRGRK